jgi:hypothetical protein
VDLGHLAYARLLIALLAGATATGLLRYTGHLPRIAAASIGIVVFGVSVWALSALAYNKRDQCMDAHTGGSYDYRVDSCKGFGGFFPAPAER